jgi:hypothetical protein
MNDIMHTLQANLQVSGYHAYLFLILAGLIWWLLESHFGRSRINGDYHRGFTFLQDLQITAEKTHSAFRPRERLVMCAFVSSVPSDLRHQESGIS